MTRDLSRWFRPRAIAAFLVDTYGKPEAVAIVAGIAVLLAYPCYWIAERAYTLIKFEIFEDELRGTPPYRTEWEVKLTEEKRKKYGREMGIAPKRALIDFPSPRACLEEGVEVLTPETLKRMDWEKMRRTTDVNVCVFRLLAASGDISHATEWFEFQGFQVPAGFSSANPYRDLDGSLRVYGVWSIGENGPKFQERGLVNIVVPAFAYEMNINASWTADGSQLLHVSIGYNTK